jgi:hypothetical protein
LAEFEFKFKNEARPWGFHFQFEFFENFKKCSFCKFCRMENIYWIFLINIDWSIFLF